MLVDAYLPNGRHTDLAKRVNSIILFGAPHRGLENTKLRELTLGKWPERLISDLSPDSYMLNHLSQYFAKASENVKIITCYELKPTPEPKALDNNPEKWRRNGPLKIMVDKQSACLNTVNEIQISIDKNHSMIAKLSTSDSAYKIILEYLSIHFGKAVSYKLTQSIES